MLIPIYLVHVHVSELQDLPPVRSHAGPGSSITTTAGGEKRKKRRKKNNGVGSKKQSGAKQSSLIRSYYYKAWDKFNVVGWQQQMYACLCIISSH